MKYPAGDGATISVDEISVIEPNDPHLGYSVVSQGTNNDLDFGGTSVTMDVDSSSYLDSFVRVEKIEGVPPDFDGPHPNYYWRISGLLNIDFTANIMFEYDPAEMGDVSLSDLTIYRGVDAGSVIEWTPYPTTHFPADNYAIASDVSEFSYWVLSNYMIPPIPPSITPAKSLWNLY